jgi:PAS domain S-box-containing protein
VVIRVPGFDKPRRSAKILYSEIRLHAGAWRRWFEVVKVEHLEQAEVTLVARERELRTLSDNVPDPICRFDRALRITFANAATEAATGIEPRKALGKTNRELGMPPDSCNLWNTTTRAVFESGQPQSIDFAVEGPTGLRHYAARLVPELGPDGEVEHVLVVSHDVTDIKRAQEALEDADRRKDEFLATLAHELRNPLAPLRTGLEIFRSSGLDTQAKVKAHEMMERQLTHLVRLVDDLLDAARISRGMVEIEPTPVEVRTILEHAVETTRTLLEVRGHTLVMLLPDAPVWVHGDLTRLAQVIGNLLDNAATYTPNDGRIALEASVESSEAVVQVTDNGIGIADEMLPRVFDLFARTDRTIQPTKGGLGIGLSLVRRVVELHGGSVHAESPGLGQGSTFTVRLPLALAEAESASAGPPPPPEPAPSCRRRVLVVDDNTDGAETLAMLLELSGHEAMVAGSGPAALEVAPAWQPDVVFLDIGMPAMNGYEVARRLRADPSTAGIVLVALTGWGSEDDRHKSKEAGFDVHLVKPVRPELVADVLARLPHLVVPMRMVGPSDGSG